MRISRRVVGSPQIDADLERSAIYVDKERDLGTDQFSDMWVGEGPGQPQVIEVALLRLLHEAESSSHSSVRRVSNDLGGRSDLPRALIITCSPYLEGQ